MITYTDPSGKRFQAENALLTHISPENLAAMTRPAILRLIRDIGREGIALTEKDTRSSDAYFKWRVASMAHGNHEVLPHNEIIGKIVHVDEGSEHGDLSALNEAINRMPEHPAHGGLQVAMAEVTTAEDPLTYGSIITLRYNIYNNGYVHASGEAAWPPQRAWPGSQDRFIYAWGALVLDQVVPDFSEGAVSFDGTQMGPEQVKAIEDYVLLMRGA